MRVRLKGLNSIRKKLADGTYRTYFYAWKGGPPLRGDLGSPEFIASYNEAVNARKTDPEGTLLSIFNAYQAASEFARLADQTRSDYRKKIKIIEAEYSDFPIRALDDRRTRGDFMAWRDRLALKSRRQADYAYAVLALMLAWAHRVCEGDGVYRSRRSESTWSDADEAAFLSKAPQHLRLALTLALWTGQRQGDLLRLTWNAYDGNHIRLTQRKTGVRVVIPVGGPLKVALDAERKRSLTILATENDTAWTESGFRASWRKACQKSGISGVTFHDLRGTAVSRLAEAQCTVPQIATITGHSLRDVGIIVDSYLKRDISLAETAIRKLELRSISPN